MAKKKTQGRGSNPASRKNLKPFSKTHRPAPGKRSVKPKVETKTIIRELLDTEGYGKLIKNKALCADLAEKFDVSELTGRQLMVVAQIAKALKGDTSAFSALLDRMDGKPRQVTENINTDMNYVDFLNHIAGEPLDDE